MPKSSKTKTTTKTKPTSTKLTPSKVVIDNPSELTEPQKELVGDIVGVTIDVDPVTQEIVEVIKEYREEKRHENDPKILEQRAKQEKNEAVAVPPDEKREHLENVADIQAQIPEPPKETKQYTHDELLDALYWMHMIFEKATMTMVCIKETGMAIKHDKPLTGDGIYIATRRLEWDSGNRHTVDTLAPYADMTDDLVTYKANNGVPVYLRICEDDYCISSPDGKPYQHEWFQLPNPFERFEEVFGK